MSEHELAVPIEPEEHYTPQSIFDALRIKQFDLDPAHPGRDNPYCCVPARRIFTKADDGLRQPWPRGALTFMNPPFGGRRGQVPWLKKFFQHRNGIALVAARTSADWFHAIVVPKRRRRDRTAVRLRKVSPAHRSPRADRAQTSQACRQFEPRDDTAAS
jgi:hypothetical protein